MGKDVIIALDFDSRAATLAFLDRFGEDKPFVKIGMELYYAEGPAIVREIKERGHKIFLDLKLHDIPNTVKKAMQVLSGLGVDMLNLHAAGTKAMMEAALEGAVRPDGARSLVIAVTQLTSTSQERMERDLLIEKPLERGWTAWSAPPWRRGRSTPPAGTAFSPSLPASALPGAMWGTRCGSLPRPRQRSWDPTISWWAAPSPRRRTRWRRTAAA